MAVEVGSMVWWRFIAEAPGPWKMGFYMPLEQGLVRMGRYKGDPTDGPVVSVEEVETKPCSRQ